MLFRKPFIARNCCPLGNEVKTKMNRLIETGWLNRFNNTFQFHQGLKIARYHVAQNQKRNETTDREKEGAAAASFILLANLKLFLIAFGGSSVICSISFILELARQYLLGLSGNLWFYFRLIFTTENNILVDILRLLGQFLKDVILLFKAKQAMRPI